MFVPSAYYEKREIELVLVEGPRRGQVEERSSPGVRRERFGLAHVRAWSVVYAHDGSDALTDQMSLVARLRGLTATMFFLH